MLENALDKSKSDLIGDFKVILSSAKKLYKTTAFDFWLKTIGAVELSELPITNCGHREALEISKKLKSQDRNDVLKSIVNISESLFTYSNEEDACIFQSTYHFYYSLTESCVFKVSELGAFEGIADIENNKFRIAKVSDLNIREDELYV